MPDTDNQAQTGEFTTHAKAAGRAFVLTWKSLLPDNFWHYGAEFTRESALALGAAIDTLANRIEGTEGQTPPPPPKPRAGRKARVEVE